MPIEISYRHGRQNPFNVDSRLGRRCNLSILERSEPADGDVREIDGRGVKLGGQNARVNSVVEVGDLLRALVGQKEQMGPRARGVAKRGYSRQFEGNGLHLGGDVLDMPQHLSHRYAREREDKGEVGFNSSIQGVMPSADSLDHCAIARRDVEFRDDYQHGSEDRTRHRTQPLGDSVGGIIGCQLCDIQLK